MDRIEDRSKEIDSYRSNSSTGSPPPLLGREGNVFVRRITYFRRIRVKDHFCTTPVERIKMFLLG